MPTRTEIIEAGAVEVCLALGHMEGGNECEIDHKVTEAALAAMFPLINAQLAAEVRELHQPVSKLLGRGWGERIGEVARFCNRCHQSLYPCATIRLIEGYEPTP